MRRGEGRRGEGRGGKGRRADEVTWDKFWDNITSDYGMI